MIDSKLLRRVALPGVVACLLVSCRFRPTTFDITSAKPVASVKTTPGKANHDPKNFEPDTAKFDWIRLTSDEWLKGELLSLRDEVLEFDSKELDELELDWKDVAEVRTSKTQTLLLVGRKTHTGKIRVDDGKLFFLGDPVREIGRSQLMAIVPGNAAGLNLWSGDVSLGITLRGGNTEQTDSSLHAFARRESAINRWDNTFDQNLSEVRDRETASSIRFDSQLKWFLTKRLYTTLPGLTFFQDEFQNIEYRVSPSVGIGYDILKSKEFEWEVNGGPAYQATRYVSVQPGEQQTQKKAAVTFGTIFEWDINKDVDFDLDYSITITASHTQDYSHHFVAKLSFEMIGDFDLDISFIWDRNNVQTEDENGNIPDADDYRTVIGFSLDF